MSEAPNLIDFDTFLGNSSLHVIDGHRSDRRRQVLLSFQFILYTVYIIYSLHYIQFTLYTVYIIYSLHYIQFALYTVCIIYSLHYIQFTLYTVSLYTVSLYAVHIIYSLHYIQFTLYTYISIVTNCNHCKDKSIHEAISYEKIRV